MPSSSYRASNPGLYISLADVRLIKRGIILTVSAEMKKGHDAAVTSRVDVRPERWSLSLSQKKV